MEKERGKNKSAAVKRRIKSYPLKLDSTVSHSEDGKRWGFIIAGVLILTIVAFLSGLRLGKSLHQLKSEEIISSPPKIAKDLEKKEIPFKLEKPKAEKSPEAPPTPPSPPIPGRSRNSSPPKAKYTLQVAALNNGEEAKQMVLQLQIKVMPLTKSLVARRQGDLVSRAHRVFCFSPRSKRIRSKF